MCHVTDNIFCLTLYNLCFYFLAEQQELLHIDPTALGPEYGVQQKLDTR